MIEKLTVTIEPARLYVKDDASKADRPVVIGYKMDVSGCGPAHGYSYYVAAKEDELMSNFDQICDRAKEFLRLAIKRDQEAGGEG